MRVHVYLLQVVYKKDIHRLPTTLKRNSIKRTGKGLREREKERERERENMLFLASVHQPHMKIVVCS